MLVIPIVGGLVAGLLVRDLRRVLIITGVLWVVGSGLLLAVTIADPNPGNGVSIGTWVAIASGLLGFPLAWAAHALRARAWS